jgi:hypothetical protein
VKRGKRLKRESRLTSELKREEEQTTAPQLPLSTFQAASTVCSLSPMWTLLTHRVPSAYMSHSLPQAPCWP